jgi:hypothetical protein
VGGLPAVNPAAHDAFGVLDRNPALAFLNCHDTGDDQSSDNNQGHQAQDADGTCVQVFKEPYRTLGHPGNDTGKDQERNPVADALFRDLLAHPHQEGCSSGDGQSCGYVGNGTRVLQRPADPDDHAQTLDEGQDDGEVTGVLGNFLAPLRALLIQPLQVGNDHCEELHDNGGVDVRRYAHGKNSKIFKSPAGNNIKESKNKPAADQLGKPLGVDPGNRDVGAQPEDKDHAQGEQEFCPEFRNLDGVL